MHLVIAVFLTFFSGWTLSVHLGAFLGLKLSTLLFISPTVILTLFGTYLLLEKTKSSLFENSNLIRRTMRFNSRNIVLLSLISLLILPLFLYYSWVTFWILSVSILVICLFRGNEEKSVGYDSNAHTHLNSDYLIVTVIAITTLALSYAISRSDLDDAFYAAVAAFTSSNPAHALTMGDPMLGEIGLPLIFPSYRFASFELLSGAGGYFFSVPAIDFYYIYLLPIWVVTSVVVIFLLAKEMVPKNWLLTGCLAVLLTLLLGEMHRSPANFSFVRIFQGKAVFLSVLVPAIFYLTARYFSDRGTRADLLLLGCCQVSSVGLTNFGMLMGPIAGFSALISNVLLARGDNSKKFLCAFSVLFIPLPYLIIVALESQGSPILTFGSESASNVWASVFGTHQQYLVGILLLAGPVLAKDSVTRWRLAIPPLFLYAILLNPFLSEFISKYVTTPPVYWRVIWSFPILLFVAISLCMIIQELLDRRFHFLIRLLLFLVVYFAGLYSLPFNTLREQNIGTIVGFADWKIPKDHLNVSKIAMTNIKNGGRILAPEEIAGVISRFENHPRLISTRGLYLNLMRSSFSPREYAARSTLYNFVTSNAEKDQNIVRDALRTLNVSVVVLNANVASKDHLDIMHSEHYKLQYIMNGYSIWIKRRSNPLE